MRGLIVVKHDPPVVGRSPTFAKVGLRPTTPPAQTKDTVTHSVSFYNKVKVGHGKTRNRRVNPGPQDEYCPKIQM